jgi:hypothetical protein
MRLTAIEPSDTGQDLRTFACPHCKRNQQHIIEISVTEAWLEPKRAVKGHQKPVACDTARLAPIERRRLEIIPLKRPRPKK